MKELHINITAEIENRIAKVRVVTGDFVFPFEGPATFTAEPTLFRATVVYFPASKTVTYELTRYAIKETGVVLEYETSGTLVPDSDKISATVERAIRRQFPLIYPALLSTLRSFFQ